MNYEDEETKNAPEGMRIWAIEFALRRLPDRDVYHDETNYREEIAPLVDAIAAGEYGLVVKAAQRLDRDGKEWARTFAFELIDHIVEQGLPIPSKNDFLRFVELCFPDIYEKIPRSTKGRTTWFEQAGLDWMEQGRGYGDPEWKRYFKQFEQGGR